VSSRPTDLARGAVTLPLTAGKSVRNLVSSTMAPAGFHGERVERSFFEGWYVKLVSADRAHRWAVIPGLFLGPNGEPDVFIQVLDGSTGRTWYHQFDRSQFQAATDRFDVRIGANRFTSEGVSLDLPGLVGAVRYTTPLQPWPVRPWAPGIMGWYAWIPTMECYHGLLSFDHELNGTLVTDAGPATFDGGRGYIEKDWGEGFPSGYVWMQTNHFSTVGTSLSASIAMIPWRGTTFRGYIVGLRHNGSLFRFATYTGAKTTVLDIDDDQVIWSLISRDGLHLSLTADRVRGGLLHAPIRTEMHRRVEETLDAKVRVRLTDRNGSVLFDDTGECAGLEVHGDLATLLDA